MFAVIETGGKQYKVEKGTTFETELIAGKKAGDTIEFDKILLLGDKSETKVGTPHVSGAAVSGKIVEYKRGDKLLVYKMKPKSRYERTQGHRQEIAVVEITEIKSTGAAKAAKATSTEEAPAKAEKAPAKKTTAAKK